MEEHLRAHGHDWRPWWAAQGMRGAWRHFIAAHLHRRLFMWFGVSIFVSVAIATTVHNVMGRGRGHWLPAMCAAGFVLVADLRQDRLPDRAPAARASCASPRRSARAGSRRARTCRRGTWARSRSSAGPSTRWRRASRSRWAISASSWPASRTRSARRSRASACCSSFRRCCGGDSKTFDEPRARGARDRRARRAAARERGDSTSPTSRCARSTAPTSRAAPLERAGVPGEGGVLDAEPGAALGFEGDATLLARALANLLENARRHGGGVTRLGVRSPRPGEVAFDVDDAGPGFPAAGETRERKDRHEGSLGLRARARCAASPTRAPRSRRPRREPGRAGRSRNRSKCRARPCPAPPFSFCTRGRRGLYAVAMNRVWRAAGLVVVVALGSSAAQAKSKRPGKSAPSSAGCEEGAGATIWLSAGGARRRRTGGHPRCRRERRLGESLAVTGHGREARDARDGGEGDGPRELVGGAPVAARGAPSRDLGAR